MAFSVEGIKARIAECEEAWCRYALEAVRAQTKAEYEGLFQTAAIHYQEMLEQTRALEVAEEEGR